ncbi:MAG TPA: protein-methionine-sulfoxide reductase catalytic subunit MsrP [Pyrinomonadaceae bacterium]|nr:protein-methionine-sulfoxide reductase catalytic subunit MsrP [Pyrinomonadaceae bacterium]
MLIKKPSDIKSSEITSEGNYLNRRNFIRAGLLAGTGFATGLAYRYFNPTPLPPVEVKDISNIETPKTFSTDEKPNTFEEITNYNNYYEFGTNKGDPARLAQKLVTRPWTVEVGGMVQKPHTFDIEELLKFDQEERIYRHRCVEAWSMVIPWVGFPLKKLLDQVEPLGLAKYVAFQTAYDSKVMLSSLRAGIDFPYLEGLRLDEALHPLTMLATGLYGKELPKQDGAPIRLVVPWKYGFKNIKSIVKITLTDQEPPTTWNIAVPEWYGFYSNVNPAVTATRWSQAKERRIGELGLRDTLPFNGYADQVAALYDGMDLKKYY